MHGLERHPVRAAAAIALLLCAHGSMAQAPVTDPARLEARITQLERSMTGGASILQIHETLQRVEREVRELRGEIEVQAHELQQLKQRQRDLYLDTDRRMKALETAAASAPPATAAPGADAAPAPGTEVSDSAAAGTDAGDAPALPPAPPESVVATADTAAEQQAYRAAFDLLKAGNFTEASAALTKFIADHPNGRFADNARYWLGESYYVRGEFGPALQSFEQLLVDFPDSPKRSHGMLKIGFIHDEQGRKDQARTVLSDLVRLYPQSTAASLASKRLQRLQ